MTARRIALLALMAAIVVLSVVSAGLLVRLEETGEGLWPCVASGLGLIAAVIAAERTTRAVPGGRLTRLRGRALPWVMLGFVFNGGVRTWFYAVKPESFEAVAGVTHTIAIALGAALAAVLICPTLERLASSLRASGAEAGAGAERRRGGGWETRA